MSWSKWDDLLKVWHFGKDPLSLSGQALDEKIDTTLYGKYEAGSLQTVNSAYDKHINQGKKTPKN